jgi:hypothetical protein
MAWSTYSTVSAPRDHLEHLLQAAGNLQAHRDWLMSPVGDGL